jgi:hypothetical protein
LYPKGVINRKGDELLLTFTLNRWGNNELLLIC